MILRNSILRLALAASTTSSVAQSQNIASDVSAIQALREQSNAAIAAHDIDKATASLLPNVRVLGSTGGLIENAAAMRSAFAKSFADPLFITYNRTPTSIEISDSDNGNIAAEGGRWAAKWKQATSSQMPMVISGIYLATWKKVDGVWKISAEDFIPLSCMGADNCKR